MSVDTAEIHQLDKENYVTTMLQKTYHNTT